MDTYKSTSSTLRQLPTLFQEFDFPELKSQQVSILNTLKEQTQKLDVLSTGYTELTEKHNELFKCYIARITQLSEAQTSMSTDLSSLKSETS